jgi:hypothetical protein
MALVDQARDYLKACGYTVEEKDRNFLLAEKAGLGGEDQTCLWVLTQEARRGRQPLLVEDECLTRFKGAGAKYRGARLHLLVDTLEGFSADFRTQASRLYGAKIQPPAQFFDMPFKHEAGRGAASAVADLAKRAEEYEVRRIPQAYEREDAAGGGPDLVSDLVSEVEDAQASQEGRVWFVVAPAGQGKSILFSALFGQLYRRFQDRKRRQVVYPRPLPMLPEHLREAAGKNVMGLIDAFLRTDVATPTTRAHLEWMVDNRFGLLMLDGLDEVISWDETFFPYLEDRLTTPGSRPAIIICVRDSLFRTSDELSNFVNYYSPMVRVFRLKPWDRPTLRTFAWKEIEGRSPREGEKDADRVTRFLTAIDSNPAIRTLATLPYYASLLLETYRDAGAVALKDEVDLLDHAVRAMCQREYGKGILREDVLPIEPFLEWLEELAVLSYEAGGISVSELRELAELLPALVTRQIGDEDERKMVAQITMAPFLTRSTGTGRVELTHEILGEYLAGRRFAKEFEANSPRFASRLSLRPWPPDSVLFRVLSRAVERRVERLVSLATEESVPWQGFRNLVQLLSVTAGGDNLLRSGLLGLAGARLGGIRFQELNLDGVSFRGCDLSSAEFINCNLRNVRFEGAVFSNTRFSRLSAGSLLGAQFGDCEHFESVITEQKRTEDHKTFHEWIVKETGKPIPTTGPCPTTLQILHLLRKFVHVDGQPRRDSLPRQAVTRGRQVPGAPEYERCAEAVLEFGFLELAAFDHIRRPAGARYGEVVSLVKSQTLTPGLRSLLDSLCRIPGCAHVPRVN